MLVEFTRKERKKEEKKKSIRIYILSMLLYFQEYQRLMCLRFGLINGVYFVLALFLMLSWDHVPQHRDFMLSFYFILRQEKIQMIITSNHAETNRFYCKPRTIYQFQNFSCLLHKFYTYNILRELHFYKAYCTECSWFPFSS